MIHRVNASLSVGTFHDAAKASEAIGTFKLTKSRMRRKGVLSAYCYLPSVARDSFLSLSTEQSPVDPTLYYKRATGYSSLGRHANALPTLTKSWL